MLHRRAFLKGLGVMPFGSSRGQGFNNPVLVNYWIGNTYFYKGSVFQYEPSPGFGNLVQSNSPVGGTDKFGNVYLAGTVSYLNGTSASVTAGGSFAIYTAPNAAGPWTFQGGFSPVSGGGIAFSGTCFEFTGPVYGPVYATVPGSLTVQEAWHPMTVLSNGWAQLAGNVNCQYRYVSSPPNNVEIIGALNAAAATANTFFTLGAGYQPASQQQFPCAATSGVTANNAPYIQATAAGALSVNRVGLGAANSVLFHGLIALDA